MIVFERAESDREFRFVMTQPDSGGVIGGSGNRAERQVANSQKLCRAPWLSKALCLPRYLIDHPSAEDVRAERREACGGYRDLLSVVPEERSRQG